MRALGTQAHNFEIFDHTKVVGSQQEWIQQWDNIEELFLKLESPENDRSKESQKSTKAVHHFLTSLPDFWAFVEAHVSILELTRLY